MTVYDIIHQFLYLCECYNFTSKIITRDTNSTPLELKNVIPSVFEIPEFKKMCEINDIQNNDRRCEICNLILKTFGNKNLKMSEIRKERLLSEGIENLLSLCGRNVSMIDMYAIVKHFTDMCQVLRK